MKTLNLIALATALFFAANGLAQSRNSIHRIKMPAPQASVANGALIASRPALSSAAKFAAPRTARFWTRRTAPVVAGTGNAALAGTLVAIQAAFTQGNADAIAALAPRGSSVNLFDEAGTRARWAARASSR